MKKTILIYILFVQLSWAQCNNITTLYFIRHAEKVDNSKNPDLSEKGILRTQQWQRFFEETSVNAVYSTDFIRTVKTAQAVANPKNISIIKYDKTLIIKDFLSLHKGQTVLLVGHSNSIPDLVNSFIGEKIYSQIPDTEFGYLYQIVISKKEVKHFLYKL